MPKFSKQSINYGEEKSLAKFFAKLTSDLRKILHISRNYVLHARAEREKGKKIETENER